MRSSFLMLSWLRRSATPVFFLLLLVLTLLTMPGRMFGWEALAADCGGAVYERVVKYWDKRFGGTGSEYIYSIASATDGGYLLGGYSYSGAGGDKSELSQGSSDYWVVKIDGQGNKVWDRRFGGSSAESLLFGLAATTNGGYLLGGYSLSSASGDRSQASQGEDDYWAVMIDGNGNKVWDKRFGGNLEDLCIATALTPDGGYVLGGYSWSGVSGDKSEASRGLIDYWVVKINGSGGKVWDKRFGGSGYDYLYDIVATSDGGYVLGGYSESGVSGDKSESSRGGYDYWVVKIDGSGNKLWDKRFGGSGDDYFYALVATADGGYVLGGVSSSGSDGDKSEPSQGQYDFWLVKINGDGNKVWDKRFGGINYDAMQALVATPDGGYLAGGYSLSVAGGDKSEAQQGPLDFWVVKIDGGGNKIWDKRFGGTSLNNLLALAVTPDGGYLLGGYSDSGADGDKTENSRGLEDFWVVHMDIDRDCDGIMDGAEARADTDPTNAVSYLAVTALNRGPGQVQVSWQGGAAVTQVIERTATLLNPAWVPVYTNPPPTAITNLLSINETNPAAAYRVRVPR